MPVDDDDTVDSAGAVEDDGTVSEGAVDDDSDEAARCAMIRVKGALAVVPSSAMIVNVNLRCAFGVPRRTTLRPSVTFRTASSVKLRLSVAPAAGVSEKLRVGTVPGTVHSSLLLPGPPDPENPKPYLRAATRSTQHQISQRGRINMEAQKGSSSRAAIQRKRH